MQEVSLPENREQTAQPIYIKAIDQWTDDWPGWPSAGESWRTRCCARRRPGWDGWGQWCSSWAGRPTGPRPCPGTGSGCRTWSPPAGARTPCWLPVETGATSAKSSPMYRAFRNKQMLLLLFLSVQQVLICWEFLLIGWCPNSEENVCFSSYRKSEETACATSNRKSEEIVHHSGYRKCEDTVSLKLQEIWENCVSLKLQVIWGNCVSLKLQEIWGNCVTQSTGNLRKLCVTQTTGYLQKLCVTQAPGNLRKLLLSNRKSAQTVCHSSYRNSEETALLKLQEMWRNCASLKLQEIWTKCVWPELQEIRNKPCVTWATGNLQKLCTKGAHQAWVTDQHNSSIITSV